MKGTGSNHFSVKMLLCRRKASLVGTPEKPCTAIQVSYAWTFGFGSVFSKFRYRLSGSRGFKELLPQKSPLEARQRAGQVSCENGFSQGNR